MARIGNLEVPDTTEGIDVISSPGGVEFVRKVANKQGRVISVRVLRMPWAGLAAFVNDHGQELVEDERNSGGLIS